MRALSARASSSSSSIGLARSAPRRLVRARRFAAMTNSSSHSAEDAARLERAKSYPYARPSSSFVFINGHAFLFDCAAWPDNAPGGRWLTNLPVRPPAALGWADAPETLSVADACARLGFCARRALELDPDPSAPAPDGHFAPILAVGSNAGVSQLARKFPPELFPDGVVVPVVRSILADYDSAFAPLITSYGAAPATLHPSPGTHVELFVTHLSPALGRRMDATEGGYSLGLYKSILLYEGVGLDGSGAGELEPTATTALSYGHQAGTLHVSFARRRRRAGRDGGAGEEEEEQEHEHTPVALAEIRARGRRFPALTQRQMLRALRHALHAAEKEDGGGEEGLAAGGSSSSSDADDAAPLVPRPLPLIPHPQDDPELAAVWLDTPESELDAFLLRCLDCSATRRRHVRRLAAAARPVEGDLAPPLSLEVLATMGTVLSDNVK